MKTKKFKVVILPTDKAPIDCIGKLFINKHGIASQIDNLEDILMSNQWFGAMPHEIYFIDDSQVGSDFIGYIYQNGEKYASKQPSVYHASKVRGINFTSNGFGDEWNKIVASTDKTITPHLLIKEAFVGDYVELYNKGNQIKEVELELSDKEYGYENFIVYPNEPLRWGDGCVLVVNPKPKSEVLRRDNGKSGTYTESDMLSIGSAFAYEFYKRGFTDSENKSNKKSPLEIQSDFENFIEEETNLKINNPITKSLKNYYEKGI